MSSSNESASTGILREPVYIEHKTDSHHPESPERLARLYDMLDDWPEAKGFVIVPARNATREELERIHTAEHVDLVASTAEREHYALDGDTPTSKMSYAAALMAAGGSIELTDRVLDGELSNGFGLVRPPGHHAEANRSMGFCLFNNIAVAAAHARDARGLEKILIVDWDLHHGNGTQHSFEEDDRALYFSAHQYPHYPGTGHFRETGAGKGEGYTINAPLPPGQGDDEYLAIFERILKPIALEYRPQLIMVSAGFDAFEGDPLGGMGITVDGYAMLAASLGKMAEEVCDSKIVYLLEGGYDLDGLVGSVKAILAHLSGAQPASVPEEIGKSPQIKEYISQLRKAFSQYWESLK